MGLLDLFKRKTINIFLEGSSKNKLEIGKGEVDYILSRSLYSSIPTADGSYADYMYGNYAIKSYIDTLAGFIGKPNIISKDDSFTNDVNNFLDINESVFINLYKTAMIDGLAFAWLKIEKDIEGKAELKVKIIPRDSVIMDECIKNQDGSFKRFVMQKKEVWNAKSKKDSQKEKKESTIRITIEPYLERWEVLGEIPPSYTSKKEEWNTTAPFVSIFPFYNNYLTFLNDGLPEVSPLLPYIKKYNQILRMIDIHLGNILDPKLKLKLKSPSSFLKSSLGIREGDYSKIESGEYKPDVTQFKVAILQDKEDDVGFINQNDNIKSALDVLNLLHWIIVELTMPEYLYGTALNTTNASVKEQSPVWIKKIEGRRAEYTHFFRWLINSYYYFSNNLNGRAKYTSLEENRINIIWQELESKDDTEIMNALKTFTESVIQLLDNGLISAKSAFNTLKNYITIPTEWEAEHEKAIEHIKEMAELEAMKNNLKNTGNSFVS